MHIDGEENALFCGGANHFKNGEAVGGKMALLNNGVVFKSHKINIQRHELHIPLTDIIACTTYNILNVFPTGLKITLANGDTERFVVNHRDEWIAAILAAKTVNV